MLGIGMGVMVLITVLSVMNGFDQEIHKRFFNLAPEVTISGANGELENWEELNTKVQKITGVISSAPYIAGQGLLTYYGQVIPIALTGIDPETETHVSHLKDQLILGKLSNLQHFGIILGRNIAENLSVMLGDQVTVM